MLKINLKQLEVLVAVVEQGGFAKAADSLFLAQSTVSSHILALEEEFNVTLFHRESKKNIRLTANGKKVYQHAKAIIAKCVTLEKEMSGAAAKELFIGASTLPSQNIIPDLVSGFIDAYPDCTCVIKNGDSQEIHQMLLEGSIQIGFVGAAKKYQSLKYEPVTEDHLVMITPNTPHYAKLKAEGTYGRDMLNENLIIREQGSGTGKLAENFLNSINVDMKKLHVVARVASLAVIRDMVARGVGVSILSSSSVSEQVAKGELLQFELDRKPVKRRIYMVYKKAVPLSEHVQNFINFALSKAKVL